MWIQDLQKATNILIERGHDDIDLKQVVSSLRSDILAIFYTTYGTKIFVHKNGLITEYDLMEGRIV